MPTSSVNIGWAADGISHSHSLSKAFADADMLIQQAMRQKLEVPTGLIEEIEQARSNYNALISDPELRTKFLAAFSALSNLLYPVTVESLQTFQPGTKLFGITLPFQRAGFHLSLIWTWTVVVFVLLVALTIFWTNDTGLLSQVESTRTELAATRKAVDEGGPTVPAVVEKRYETAKGAFASASAALEKNFIGFASRGDSADGADGDLTFEITARAAVKTQETSILPLLFGALGACVQSLRRMSTKISERRYLATDIWGEYVRLLTGAVFGVVISYLITPDEVGSIGKSLTPLGLAFIAGYSSELLLAALDRVIWSGRTALQSNEQQTKDKQRHDQEDKARQVATGSTD